MEREVQLNDLYDVLTSIHGEKLELDDNILKSLVGFVSDKNSQEKAILCIKLSANKHQNLVYLIQELSDIIIQSEAHIPEYIEGAVLGLIGLIDILPAKTYVVAFKSIEFLRDSFIQNIRPGTVKSILRIMTCEATSRLPRDIRSIIETFQEDICGYFPIKLQRAVIGQGSYGTVYQGYHRETALPVAIKCLEYNKISEKGKIYLNQELKIMKLLDTPYVVKLYEYQFSHDHRFMYVIMELCPLGDLGKYLKSRKGKGYLPIEEVIHFMRELAKALQSLKERSIVHRDLKPANILLVKDSNDIIHLKLCDFTFAREIEKEDVLNTICGSPLYMAPERLTAENYGWKAELWSVGIIYYELLYNTVPWEANNVITLYKVLSETPLEFPNTRFVNPEIMELVSSLLQIDPEKRLSWENFFGNPVIGLPSSTIMTTQDILLPIDISSSSEALSVNSENQIIPENSPHRDPPELPSPDTEPQWLAIELENFYKIWNSSVKIQQHEMVQSGYQSIKSIQTSLQHTFRRSSSRLPTPCIFCWKFIGLFAIRMRCTKCLYCSHPACVKQNSDKECSAAIKSINGHTLSWSTFLPRWCSVCQGYLWGLTQQGLFCKFCQIAVHNHCVKDLKECTGTISAITTTTTFGDRHGNLIDNKVPLQYYDEEGPMMRLSDELLMFVLMFLSADDLKIVSQVNKRCLCVFLTIIEQSRKL